MKSSARSVHGLAIAVVCATAAAGVFGTGCASSLGTVTSKRIVTSMRPAIPAGSPVVVTVADVAAVTGLDAGSGRIATMADGAESALTRWRELGAGSGEAAVVWVALMPLAALVGAAMESGRELPVEQVQAGERAVREGLAKAARQGEFRDQFFLVSSNPSGLAFVSASSLTSRGSSPRFADAMKREAWNLELRVDSMQLRRTDASGAKFALVIGTTARLRDAAGVVIFEAPLEYESETAAFIDWAGERGAPLRRVAEFGYRCLAEKVIGHLQSAVEIRNS